MSKTASTFDLASYYGASKAEKIKRARHQKKSNATPLQDTSKPTQNELGKQFGLFDSTSSIKQLVHTIEEEIEALADSSLKGRDRRRRQLQKLVSLGALEPKPPKTPFRILKGIRAKQVKREKKQKELEKGGSVLVRHATLSRPSAK